VSPDIFYQLFTVHVLIEESVIPCIYALLPNKNRDTYSRFWAAIKSESEEEFEPLSILSDFELASVQAVREHFPGAQVVGYFFHLCQSLFKHVKSLSLCITLYLNDDDI
jgi:hypothetical protein